MIIYALLGITAGVVAFSASIPYVRGILAGTTKPDRATWWILAVLNAMIAASSYALGAWNTLWLPIGYTLIFFIYALLSLSYGEGPISLSRLQKFCILGALGTAILWWLSGSALITLILTIAIDLLGLTPTIYKSFLRPWYEDRTAWLIAFIASAINIFAVEQWTLAIALYPIYVLITNGIILSFLMRPRILQEV